MKRRFQEAMMFAIVNFFILFLLMRNKVLFVIFWSISWAIGRLIAQLLKNVDVRICAKTIIIIDLIMLILPINWEVKAMMGTSILLPAISAFVITWIILRLAK